MNTSPDKPLRPLVVSDEFTKLEEFDEEAVLDPKQVLTKPSRAAGVAGSNQSNGSQTREKDPTQRAN